MKAFLLSLMVPFACFSCDCLEKLAHYHINVFEELGKSRGNSVAYYKAIGKLEAIYDLEIILQDRPMLSIDH